MTLPDPPPDATPFRWQSLFQKTTDPLFLLNRRRKVLFVNRAWEELTGLTLAEVKGHVCRRQPRGILTEQIEGILGALAPPADLKDRTMQVRRQAPHLGSERRAWRVTFLQLRAGDVVWALLGKIEVLPAPRQSNRPPLPEKVLQLREESALRFQLENLIGDHPAMIRLRAQIGLAALTNLPVSITGPAGVGKQWLARVIHEQGPGRHHFFATIDCGRLPANVLANLLFDGRLKPGADVATVYLKDADSLPREIQAQLSQWLATEDAYLRMPRLLLGRRGNPVEETESGPLPDLLFQASPITLHIPPLCDRLVDLPAWIENLLPRAAAVAEKQVHGVSTDAMHLLAAHSWPENLAELYRVLFQACSHARGERVEPADLPFYLRAQPVPQDRIIPLDKILEEAEKRLLTIALRLANNNKSRAAELLAIWRPRLLRRMEALGIGDPEKGLP